MINYFAKLINKIFFDEKIKKYVPANPEIASIELPSWFSPSDKEKTYKTLEAMCQLTESQYKILKVRGSATC